MFTKKVVAACVGALALAGSALVAPAASAGWSRDCSGVSLEPGADLRRCDLIGRDVTGRDLSRANLSRADAANLFAGCDPDVGRTLFVDATLHRTDLRRARLCDADLTNADLRHADLTRAQLEDADLDGANLRRAKLKEVGAINATFRSADLRRADLRGGNLFSAVLAGADLRLARLAGVDLSIADLTGARLRGATGLHSVTWRNTTCPDGTNSDDTRSGTCRGHLHR